MAYRSGNPLSNWTSSSKRTLIVVGFVAISIAAGTTLGLSLECQNMGYCIWPFSPGTVQKELLNVDHYNITTATGQSNPSILKLWLHNFGSVSLTISSLSVTDLGSGGTSATFQLSETVPSGATVNLTVDTSGPGLYFVSGHTYSVTVLTSRNTSFIFQVIY